MIHRTLASAGAGIVLVLLLFGNASAGCYVQFNEEANRVMHMGGDTQRGSFADPSECEAYQSSRPGFEQNNSWCVCTEPDSSSDNEGTKHDGGRNHIKGQDTQRDEQERVDAMNNANENGIDCYERGDWNCALRYFELALEYSPYNPSIISNINKVKEKLRAQVPTAPVQAPKAYDTVLKERTMKMIKELNCGAHWALNALDASLTGDALNARRYGEYSAQAKGGNTASGCPEVRLFVPEVPPPVEVNPQLRTYNYIMQQAEILVPAVIDTQKKIQDTKSRIEKTAKEIVVRKDEIKHLDKIIDNPKIKKESQIKKAEAEKELDELEKLARELQKGAEQLNRDADEQKKKRDDLKRMHEFVKENPQRADELYK
ncbi:MAG: hypothetical protein C4581_12910 [Nitrospiraceae bacterium]|nr:MAG: hypothetical protein C4581_12910 [Nitrospiraceae bacterium]